MEILTDNSANFSALETFYSDSSMFFCHSKSEQEKQQQQLSKECSQINVTVNKKQQKSPTVSFPFGKCRICHDKATGVHYGVTTCEGCKGFFKRSITQGIPYRCFFGDDCIINMKTRNRCKACRFKRCVHQGMAMESVKMGRIPKKIKEKALKNYQKQQEKTAPYDDDEEEEQQPPPPPPPPDNNQDDDLSYIDEYQMDDYSLSSVTGEAISSFSSSSSSASSVNARQSIDSKQEIICVPQRILSCSEKVFRTADLIELTIASSNIQFNDFDDNLSALRLPSIFHELYSSPETFPDALSQNPICNNETMKSAIVDNNHSSENFNNKNTLTVSGYISKRNENTIVDYMFNWELRYSRHVLQIMKYIAPKLCQPFLIYELDFEVTSFFRYIRWKMFNSYLKHTKRLRILVKRMFGVINLGITEYLGVPATSEQMWLGIQSGLSSNVTDLLEFAKDTPGLNELNVDDFTRILNHRIFEFWIIIHYPLFYKNESYVMTMNGLHYSRSFMNQFIGKKTTDAIHEFSERFHSLNITQVEHSLIIPIVLCLPHEQLIDTESVHIIKYCYMYALYIQLCTTRTEDEAKSVFDHILQIVDSIGTLNQLCNANIGKLVVEKKHLKDDSLS